MKKGSDLDLSRSPDGRKKATLNSARRPFTTILPCLPTTRWPAGLRGNPGREGGGGLYHPPLRRGRLEVWRRRLGDGRSRWWSTARRSANVICLFPGSALALGWWWSLRIGIHSGPIHRRRGRPDREPRRRQTPAGSRCIIAGRASSRCRAETQADASCLLRLAARRRDSSLRRRFRSGRQSRRSISTPSRPPRPAPRSASSDAG